MERTVIVGAGQAGGRAAVALRNHGYDGEIVLVGEEAIAPYERPPLSKDVLSGSAEPGALSVNPNAAYREKSIDLRLGIHVSEIDPARREIVFAEGGRLGFDRLILATGARARRLDWPCDCAATCHYLRTYDDALALREALSVGSGKVAIIGGGFIGLEVAASARQLGWEAIVIELGRHCLERVLPAASAKPLVDWHEYHGTEFRWDASVRDTVNRDGKTFLVLDDGEAVEADLVVVGIGSQANMGLAQDAGLACDDGIVVDAQCRTSAPGIFAIGDVAMAPNRWFGRSLRLESWENAERQAEQVACVICGEADAPDDPPWFWTDQFGHNVQMIGAPSAGDVLTVEEGQSSDQFVHVYARGDVITGAVLFNSGRRRRALSRQIRDAWNADGPAPAAARPSETASTASAEGICA